MSYRDYFKTERLIIRRFQEEDCEDLRKYAIYKMKTGFEAFNPWPTDSSACQDVAKFFAASDHYWAIERKTDCRMIGFISFNQIDEEKHLDLGYGFTPLYTENNENVEALKTMIQYAFDSLPITAIDARNEHEWKEQVEPLFLLGFQPLEENRMQMTRTIWDNRK